MGVIATGACILNALFLRETRGDVLLAHRDDRLTKKSGI